MEHIKRLHFSGIRRLNPSQLLGEDTCDYDFHFSDVNVFVGENGGGKSTVLDLLDAIREPSRLVTLPRENKRSIDSTYFNIDFSNGARFKGIAHPNSLDDAPDALNVKGKSLIDVFHLGVSVYVGKGDSFHFSKNVCKSELDTTSQAELKTIIEKLDIDVHYWDCEVKISNDELVKCLNLAAPALPGVFSSKTKDVDDNFCKGQLLAFMKANPFLTHEDDDKVRVWLSDDLHQTNHVQLKALPSGWKRIASIFTWLKKLPKGAVCLIEEPEIHLHHTLQRYLAVMMESMVQKKGLQIFITTHSTVFQQPNLWSKPPNIFHAKGSMLEAHPDAWMLMDTLGIRGSDISQSNGIVWVEGPSDRIYIKHWLELYCKKYNRKVPDENVDYSFNLYGGAVLSHLSATERDSFISMLKMNRNLVLVIDRDLDFHSENDVLVPKNSLTAKARIIGEINSLHNSLAQVWVTDKYTIESYLPVDFQKDFFKIADSGRLALMKSSKVAIAKAYSERFVNFDTCSDIHEKLEARIAALYSSITSWNQHDFPLWPGE